MSNIAIIIDVWKYNSNLTTIFKPRLANNIVNFLNSGKIDVAVLASYDCEIEIFSNNVWYKKKSKRFLQYTQQKNNPNKQQTQDMLLNYTNTKIQQLAMRHMSDFKKIVNDHSQIYMCGAAWNLCVKNRDLGYINVQKHFPSIPIFVDINTVSEQSNNMPNMANYPNWIIVSQDIYKYKPL